MNESTSLDVINFDKVESVVEKNIEKIKGIKVKASKFQSNKNGIDIIKKSKQVAKKLNLPLVVYIGEYPSYIDEVMNILGKEMWLHQYMGIVQMESLKIWYIKKISNKRKG